MKRVKFLPLLLLPIALFCKEEFVYETPHATHQHVLKALLERTSGPIIEFGCGDSSTPLLHEHCKKTNRLLISLDDNQDWLEKFSSRYLNDGFTPDNSGWHKFYFVPGKIDNITPDHWVKFFERKNELMEIDYSICFVDQSPWKARFESIKRFKDKCRFVLLHDCNYFPEKEVFGSVIKILDRKARTEGEFDFSDTFPFYRVYYPSRPWPGSTGPPTLVGSMFESDLPSFN